MECYLDNSATTAVSPAAAALALRMMTEEFGNPSSLHRRGFLAERALTEARGQVAAVLHCRPDEIIFTSGGTESNNIALLGAAHALRRRGNRIVTTAVEHHSILAIGKALEAEGFEVITVSPDESGHITPEAMAAACNEKTILVSCMMVNSETGALHNIPAIAAACRRKNPNIVFHSDCVQAFCRLPIEPAKWGVQLVSVSGHKIHAPKGIGALYVAKGTRLLPAIYGSGQEKGLRPGTENVPGIAAMGLAAQQMNQHQAENLAHFAALRQQMITNLSQSPAICINSPADAAPYIVNCSVQGIRSEVMIHYLEQFGIYVSSGSACAKGERSHVLTAMGLGNDRIDSAVRISMTDTTTPEEIDEFCRRLLQGEATLTKRR
ncbi:MAG TPA: cysteine desulfurase [Ruminococcaceae bacterium]|nr:cysteine desulfurase [Oscillospiraceae bacterium]